ncbi:PREDICTED: leukocyte receptor cluster member 1 homolog [Amphimedon queenslandica]|uniref:CBF1-interacting co-repressor CIR N-terminal domain-containing protein n=1 Tax=Amphimedon queenslandica TaxID=400682 RepID=A0A1X7ULV2_AMPQE|nr:PREDICTED: leukocyte receptor cluster member 1 homolog [Amphimedon queenslandica]|eukprot:XP_003387359.1 PREDICTED: leukocyte receptor cluster member 1 homolog [Amphimedon queenslandica]
MNILPKKSWHVLTRDNLERVRRDEAEAKRQEEEKAKRAALAEQEAKIEFMRKRAREEQQRGQYEDLIRTGGTSETKAAPVETDRHINFFADMKTGVGLEGSVNPDHEKELKQEQETWEKKTGILTYLVDKEGASSEGPWYAKKKDRKDKRSHEEKKARMDPLNDMMSYVDAKRKCLDSSSSSSLSTVTPKAATSKDREEPPEKSKKKKKKKREEEKKAVLERLRAERKRREGAEKVRSDALMKKHYGLEEAQERKEEATTGRYNSQYNPHLSRT